MPIAMRIEVKGQKSRDAVIAGKPTAPGRGRAWIAGPNMEDVPFIRRLIAFLGLRFGRRSGSRVTRRITCA